MVQVTEIFGAVSEDLLGGAGKAEDVKLPGAGISLKQCPGKMSGRKSEVYFTQRESRESRVG